MSMQIDELATLEMQPNNFAKSIFSPFIMRVGNVEMWEYNGGYLLRKYFI